MKDRRYNISSEFIDNSGKKRFVLRFNGTRVSDHATRYEAEQQINHFKKTTEPNVKSSRILVEG